MPATDVVKIQSNAAEKGQLVLEVKNKSYFVSFNTVSDAKRPAGGPFTLDQGKAAHDMRLAFTLSIDRTKLAKDLCANVACISAVGGVIPKGLLGYLGDGSDPLAAFDPVKARSLLLAADPTGTKSKELIYSYDPENPFNEPTAKFLQAQWLENLGNLKFKHHELTAMHGVHRAVAGDITGNGWDTYPENQHGDLVGVPQLATAMQRAAELVGGCAAEHR